MTTPEIDALLAERDALRDELVSWHKGRNVRAEAAEAERDALKATAWENAIAGTARIRELEAERDSLREQLAAKLKAGNAFREAYEAEVERGIALREQLREAREALGKLTWTETPGCECGLCECVRLLSNVHEAARAALARNIRDLATQDNGARAGDTPKRLKLDLPTGWNTPDGCEPPEPTDTPEHPHIEGCTPYDGHDDTGCADACPHNQSALRRYGLADPTDTKPEPSETAQLRERNAELARSLEYLRGFWAEQCAIREKRTKEVEALNAELLKKAPPPRFTLAEVARAIQSRGGSWRESDLLEALEALEASGKTKEVERHG